MYFIPEYEENNRVSLWVSLGVTHLEQLNEVSRLRSRLNLPSELRPSQTSAAVQEGRKSQQ